MFRKNKCSKCGKSLDSKANFCHNCGSPVKSGEDWGMLGKNDFESRNLFSDSFFRGFSGGMLNKMLGSAMKMLEREMKKEIERENSHPKTSIRLMINGQEIPINQSQKQTKKEKKKIPQEDFSKENLKKFSSFKKEEPVTNIRRFSDRIIYEIRMPEIKSKKDVLITQLENSIEIKAVAKNKAYFKSIPVALPVIDYELSEGKLILELEAKQ